MNSLLEVINSIIVFIGVPSILIGCIHIGRKLQVLDNLDKDSEEIKSDLKRINNRCFKLESATVELQTSLSTKGRKFSQKLEVAPGSPLKLTPYGEELAKETNAFQFIKDHKELFFSMMDNKSPSTAYDVQAVARSLFDESLSNPIMNDIKNYAYNHGMNIEVLLNILGVILRDEYLKAHPEITK